MSQGQTTDRSWLSLEGYIKPLHHEVGPLQKLRERGNSSSWFVLQDNARLLYYNQKSSTDYLNLTPEGSFGISSGKLDIFVVLTSDEGKEYLLSPVNDFCYGDWLTNLKKKINASKSASSFERGSSGQGGFMSRVRNSLRRKKKLGRSMSEDVTGQMGSSRIKKEEAIARSFTPERKHKAHENILNEYRKERSHSYPRESEDEKVKTYADKACDTSSLVSLDLILTDGSEDSTDSEKPANARQPRQKPRKLLKAVGIDYDLQGQTDSNEKGVTVFVNQSLGRGSDSKMESTEGQTDSNEKGVNQRLIGLIAGTKENTVIDLHETHNDLGQTDMKVVSLVNQRLTDMKVVSLVNQGQTDMGDVSLVNQGQTDMKVVSLVNQRLTDMKVVSLVNQGQTDIGDVSIVSLGPTDMEDVSLVNQRRTEMEDVSLVNQRQTDMEDASRVNQDLHRQTDTAEVEGSLVNEKTHTIQGTVAVNPSITRQTDSIKTINQSIPGQTGAIQRDTPPSRYSESRSETEKADGKPAILAERPQAGTFHSEKLLVSNVGVNLMDCMSLQQQKIIRELEIEVCKLKCEVISLIQGTIKVPLKDDDIADWDYVEEIRYKDRIFELLREARLYNPSLPDLDSSKSSNFKDAYGFIHGSRESESVVFQFVCRELTQHYSSFFRNKTGYVKFWDEYTKAKKKNDDNILYKEKEIKLLVQDGIPSSMRAQVWKSFISGKVDLVKATKGVNFYKNQARKTGAKKNKLKSEMSEVERQIRCDLLRTMPNNENFKTLESERVTQLSRILHVFADLRPDIGYLQGMNFLVGLFLLFLGEEDAFWSLYAVVDVYLKNYFDRMLSGVQADQEVLKELIAEKLPVLNSHLKSYGVDISTVTFNWFITVYLDAVPFETAVRIWDSFLFEGREVLFRIAIGLLKLQERSLLQLSGHLEIMQYMKRAARVMYDVDRLFKASFEEMTKFPTNEMLDERQKQHRTEFKSMLGHVSPIKHETSRARVSSFTVELPSQGKVDRLDQYQLVECAVTTSKDLSGPVCIPCSVRGDAKVYLLDINKKELSTLNSHINSRILCADVLGDGTVLIGTIFWCVYAFDIESRTELWSVPLRDSVIDLCHYDHETDDKVYAALADGCIAVLPNANASGPPSQGSRVPIGSAPVMCVTMVDDQVWCGCGSNVVVLDASSLEELHATVVSSSPRHQVARLLEGNDGVWCTIRGSSLVMLIDQNSYELLLKIDVALDTTIIDAVSESQVTVSPFQESRVTTVMPFANELWLGLGNGQVLIFDVIENDTSSEDENWLESSDTHDQDTPPELSDKASSEFKFSLKMRVQYRVSEEPIRSLEVLRETDDPVVLSCASTLSPEGGLSIWQKQATQEDLYEWMNYPIKHSQAADDKVFRG